MKNNGRIISALLAFILTLTIGAPGVLAVSESSFENAGQIQQTEPQNTISSADLLQCFDADLLAEPLQPADTDSKPVPVTNSPQFLPEELLAKSSGTDESAYTDSFSDTTEIATDSTEEPEPTLSIELKPTLTPLDKHSVIYEPSVSPEEMPSQSPSSTTQNTASEFDNILEIAREDGKRAAQILNAYKMETSYYKTLNDTLKLYYSENLPNQRTVFLAFIGESAQTLCKKYADADAERGKSPEKLGFVPGELIAMLKTASVEPQSIVEELGCVGYETLMPASSTGAGEMGVYKIPISETVDSAVELFKQNRQVSFAEPNYVQNIEPPVDNPVPYDFKTLDDTSKQWYLNDINIPKAWDILSVVPHTKVRVAVIDTGVDASHSDLQSNLNKILCVNTLSSEVFQDLNDSGGHGTHVTGTIAATTNNGIGVNGAATGNKNDTVEVISAKVSSDGKNMSFGSVIRALEWARSNNAKVINMSLGGTDFYKPLETAVDAAVNDGITVIAAAGNKGDETLNYPADLDSCISVIATDETKNKASFSNFGINKDISAPGAYIYNTVPEGYAYKQGTSMASPIAASVAAMMYSVYPNITPAQVRTILIDTADDVGDPGFDKYTANGIVNAYEAVKAAYEKGSGKPLPDMYGQETDFVYTYNSDGTLKLIEYKGNAKNVDVPAKIDGKTVTAMAPIFENNQTIESVTLPDDITLLEDRTFYQCYSLKSVKLPSKLARINTGVFYNCQRLTDLSLPPTLTYIGESAFENCWGLTDITIPAAVIDIGRNSFKNCVDLTSVTFTDGIQHIGESAFEECERLKSLIFPASLKTLGDNVVNNCKILEFIKFLGVTAPIRGDLLGELSDGYVTYYKAGAAGFGGFWRGYVAAEEGKTPNWELNKVPQNLNAHSDDGISYTISWWPVKGASHYEVYRLEDGSFCNLGTTYQASFTDSDYPLQPETKYKYKVRAYIDADRQYGAFSAEYSPPPLYPRKLK